MLQAFMRDGADVFACCEHGCRCRFHAAGEAQLKSALVALGNFDLLDEVALEYLDLLYLRIIF